MTAQTPLFAAFPHFDPKALGLVPPAQPTRPHLEVQEHPHEFRLRARIPELRANEIQVRVGPDFLEVEGEHHSTWRPRVYLGVCFAEPARRDLEFARRFTLHNVDVAAARATFVNGVLELHLPKLKRPVASGEVVPRVLDVATRRAA